MALLVSGQSAGLIDFDIQLIFSVGLQLVSTVFLIFLLFILLYKPVLAFLDARTKRIKDAIDNANAFKKEAEDMKANYQNILSEANEERIRITNEATKKAKEIEETILLAAQEEALRIKENALREIEVQKEKARVEMQSQIIDISAIIAGKYVESKIDASLQARLLEQTIEDLGDATWFQN
ncbi:MAG: F0F1 ATP synthase subunit B [Defluviitaleaceae bacterium]|nr:F0F1 ATP synthase subunit B [Defluviitaleaceae bacterium]